MLLGSCTSIEFIMSRSCKRCGEAMFKDKKDAASAMNSVEGRMIINSRICICCQEEALNDEEWCEGDDFI